MRRGLVEIESSLTSLSRLFIRLLREMNVLEENGRKG